MSPRPIYLDYMASTPCDESIIAEMSHWHRTAFANPHSVDHVAGREAEAAIDMARAQVAAHIGASEQDIIFTSGATEANNLAIKGSLAFLSRYAAAPEPQQARKPRIIVSAGEHKCVREAAVRATQDYGFELCLAPLNAEGIIDLEAFEKLLSVDTVLVSIMAVNNETGSINPVAEISALCRKAEAEFGCKRILFHTDAAQAIGKIALDVQLWDVDLLSLSGHKVYAPKGIGALYVRRRPRVRLIAEMDGGGQQRGLRSGTTPTPLVIGLGHALELAGHRLKDDHAQCIAHRALFLKTLHQAGLTEQTAAQGYTFGLNGPQDEAARLPGALNIYFSGMEAAKLLEMVPHLWVSRSSACSSADLAPSHVLKAMGLPDQRIKASFRVCFGRPTTSDEVRRAAHDIAGAVLHYAPHDSH